jgi:hypothetical protein
METGARECGSAPRRVILAGSRRRERQFDGTIGADPDQKKKACYLL